MAAKPSAASKQLKNWKSGQYVVSHATNTALETCKACASEYDRKKADLQQLANAGDQDSPNGLATLEEKHAASYWKKASDSCRFSHLSKCSLVSEDVRSLAQIRSQKKRVRKTAKQQKQEDESLEEELLALATPLDATIIVAPTFQPTESRQVALEKVQVKEEEQDEAYTDSMPSEQPTKTCTRKVGKRAPAWSHAYLVSFHPTRSKYETCRACLDVLLGERVVLQTYLYSDNVQADARERLRQLDAQIESMYWDFTSTGRMVHLAECQHQTPETRSNAALRRDAGSKPKVGYTGSAALASTKMNTDCGNIESSVPSDSHVIAKVGDEELDNSAEPLVQKALPEKLADEPHCFLLPDHTTAYEPFDDDEGEVDNDGKDADYIQVDQEQEEPKEEYIQTAVVKGEGEAEEIRGPANIKLIKPVKTTPWQSSYLTVKHPAEEGKEGCKACVAAYTEQLGAVTDDAEIQAISAELITVYWRNPRTRMTHLANCPRQPADVREKARVRRLATARIQRNSDDKKAKRELEAASDAETVTVRKRRRVKTATIRAKSQSATEAPKRETPRASHELVMDASMQAEATIPSYFIPSSPQSLSWRA